MPRLPSPELIHRAERADVFGYRISEIEQQIGAGLIEEIIQVAEGELKVVDELYKSKA